MINTYKRDDGDIYEADAGSVLDKLLAKDPRFTLINSDITSQREGGMTDSAEADDSADDVIPPLEQDEGDVVEADGTIPPSKLKKGAAKHR